MANTIVVKHRSADTTEPAGLLAGEIAANINASGKKIFIGTGSGNIVFPDQTYVDNGFQPLDADLTAIAALANADGNIIVGNGSTWVAESGATARTSLGVSIGADVQAYSTVLDDLGALAQAAGNTIRSNGTDYIAVKNNISASAAPTANDDSGAGYVVGSVWLDTTNDKGYMCLDATSTAAVWADITASAGTGEANTASNIGTAGVGVFDQKSGLDLQFRNINTTNTNAISIVDDSANNEIDIVGHASLESIASLTTAANNMIYTTASNTYATTALTAAGRALLDDADASAQRTTLGLAIGTDVQAYDAGLASIAGLTTAADTMIYTTALDTYTTTSLTTFGRSLIDDADAGTARTTLGLGSLATQSTVNFTDVAAAAVVTAVETIASNSTDDTSFPTTKAVFDHVSSAVAGGVNYQGAYNASTNTPDLDTSPSGVLKGHMYTVTVAGTFFTIDLEVGDVLIAEIDNAAAAADWTIVQRNIINDQLIDGGTY